MAKIRILMAIGSYKGGGAEKQCMYLVNALLKAGYEVAIVSFSDKDHEFSNEDVKRYVVGRRGERNLLSRFIATIKSVKDFKPDIIHAWLPETITIPVAIGGLIYKVPTITSRRTTYSSILKGGKIRTYLNLIAELLSYRVVSNSKVLETNGFIYHRVYNWRKGICIPNGVTEAPLQNTTIISEIKKDKNIKLLYVGRFISSKKIDLLLKVFAMLKDEGFHLSLYLYGGTKEQIPNLNDLKDIFSKYSADIHCMGYCSNWREIASAFDIFVQPSILEGMSNSLLEAFSVNLPTVATEIPPNLDVCENNVSAILAKPNDKNSLYQSIRTLLLDEKLRNKIIRGGSDVVKKYSLCDMANSYFKVYRNILQIKNSK